MTAADLTLAQWELMACMYWFAMAVVLAVYLLEAALDMWLNSPGIDVLELTDVVQLPPPETAEVMAPPGAIASDLPQTCPARWVRSPRRAF